MIQVNGKEIERINVAGKELVEKYVGNRLVWEAVRSCFGRGYWINEKPWKDTDGWRNNR